MSTHPSIRAANVFTLMLAAALLLLGGCSGGFEKKFETARAMPIPAGDPIVGAWEGTWTGTDGHAGPLRAILTPAGTNAYRAEFHAGYSIFTHESTVMLTGQRLGNKLSFRGEEDLGWMAGGVFNYQGTVTPTTFHSTYDSEKHDGVYEMHRPEGVEPFGGN